MNCGDFKAYRTAQNSGWHKTLAGTRTSTFLAPAGTWRIGCSRSLIGFVTKHEGQPIAMRLLSRITTGRNGLQLLDWGCNGLLLKFTELSDALRTKSCFLGGGDVGMGCLRGWVAFQRWLKAVGACCSDFLCCVIRCAVCIIETHRWRANFFWKDFIWIMCTFLAA